MRRVRAVRILIDRSAMCETDARDGARSQSTVKPFIEGLLAASSLDFSRPAPPRHHTGPLSYLTKSDIAEGADVLIRTQSVTLCSGSYVCLYHRFV